MNLIPPPGESISRCAHFPCPPYVVRLTVNHSKENQARLLLTSGCRSRFLGGCVADQVPEMGHIDPGDSMQCVQSRILDDEEKYYF